MASLSVMSPEHSWKNLNEKVLGAAHYRLHPVLTSHIGAISKFIGVSNESLLIHGTGYVLYAMALSRHDKERLKQEMLWGSGNKIGAISKQTPSSLVLPKVYKYCSQCVCESTAKYGLPKWHIEHQLYGVTHCVKHKDRLDFLVAGEGGVNREYVMPKGGEPISISAGNEKALYLSSFITKLFHFCQRNEIQKDLTHYYRQRLDNRELLTQSGQLRFQRLSSELKAFWKPLFSDLTLSAPTSHRSEFQHIPTVPLDFCDFHFVPSLVHGRSNMHYLKHVMLMAYLAKDPEQFFHEKSETISKEALPQRNPKINNEHLIVDRLREGLSMRKISQIAGVSVSYIQQLAGRNNINVGKRTKFIDESIKRDVWRKAFQGTHRACIAEQNSISIKAVESIIQSHAGLSAWRHHLRRVDGIRSNRKTLLACMHARPEATRNQIKNSCSSYSYLFKHDKEWLYQHLPSRDTTKFYAITDWTQRDEFLAIKLKYMEISANSISEVDRYLGGHGWLIGNANKLPHTLLEAQNKLINTL